MNHTNYDYDERKAREGHQAAWDAYCKQEALDEREELIRNVSSITCARGSWGYDLQQGQVQTLWLCGLDRLDGEGRTTDRPCAHATKNQAIACICTNTKE